MVPAMTRNDPTVVRLATEAECDPRTALSPLVGRPVKALVMLRIRRAAKKLRLTIPPRSNRAPKAGGA